MERKLFRNRKEEFKEFVIIEQRLPRRGEIKFKDGEDLRTWFDAVIRFSYFQSFIDEIKSILEKFSFRILGDNDKEEEFIDYVIKNDHIPGYKEGYFSDNSEMKSWFNSYKNKNSDFETRVHELLTEYKELDISEVWFFVREECIEIVKKIKRIPYHGEVVTQSGIDVRSVFDKLKSNDPMIYESIVLMLSTYKDNRLSIENRVQELCSTVRKLKYIPFIEEEKFSDGVDMYYWYNTYKDRMPGLETRIDKILDEIKQKSKVNIYLIPNFKKNGGKRYTICTNVGDKIDLDGVCSFDDLKVKDSTVLECGEVILKNDEEIGSVSFVKKKSKNK